MAKYLPPIKYLGTSAVLLVLVGLFFPEDAGDSVLVRSIPFVAVFVAIILTYILFIFMIALTFNGKIPYRTYRPIELSIIVGILVGVVCLFQPWQIISYQYGFLLLLGTTLFFILWSHVKAQSAQAGESLPKFSSTSQLIAAGAGIAVWVLLAYTLATATQPEAPYGYSQRQWEKGLREEQRQEIIEDEENTYQNFTVPFFIFLSLFPASTVFFLSREVVASTMGGSQAPSVSSGIPARHEV